mgnify:CR=1 FL=1
MRFNSPYGTITLTDERRTHILAFHPDVARCFSEAKTRYPMIMIKYFYDKEADVFYFSDGTPRQSDETIEAKDDVLLRVNPRTKRIRGFTLINASHRTQSVRIPAPLPFSLTTTA